MLVSFNWLKEFVDIELPAEDVADVLTMAGIEVEAVSHFGKNLNAIITARIEEVSSHPNASNLKVVKVSAAHREWTVVCGAPNVAVGHVVAYAPPGTILPKGVEITQRSIKGVNSPGMICSEKELGIGEDASGILILDPGTEVGLRLPEALPFLEDCTLEVSVTPNRGDCLSVLGIARELAALFRKPWRIPEFTFEEGTNAIGDFAQVEVPDSDLCHRYVIRMVQGITVAQSPLDIRLRLTRSGLRPISNVVDVTNLVLLECGQPLHAFDYRFLQDGKIVVRRCDRDETFVTLDGTQRALPPNSLMIRDGRRSVALAGIMGGMNSEIVETTSSVLIESACFERFGIRRTAKALGMSTEASYRFERGVDPDITLWAAHRATYLMHVLAGGKVVRGYVDVYPHPVERRRVQVRPGRVNSLLGLDLKQEHMADYLHLLGIRSERNGKHEGILSCTAPSWRWDLEREVDMIEEIARMHGFQNIPVSMPSCLSSPDPTTEAKKPALTVHECMNAAGFTEVITMSFLSREAHDAFAGAHDEEEPLELLNPLTEDSAVMRTSLLAGLIAVAKRNISFRSDNLRLYEIGKVFSPVSGQELPLERLALGAIALGKRYSDLWHFNRGELDICGKIDTTPAIDFYDMKGALETVLDDFDASSIVFRRSAIPFLHPGKSVDVFLGDLRIGFLGELDPKRARELDFGGPVEIFEILLEPLFVQGCKKRVFRQIPRYPYIERDLSLMVETNCSGDDIKQLISRLGHDIIASVILFDLYRGESIPEGSQSMAFRIRYQSPERTLTDDEVQEVHSEVVKALVKELGATMRA